MGAKYTYALGNLKGSSYKNLSALLKLLSKHSKAVATSGLFGIFLTISTIFLSLTAEAQQSVQVLWPLTNDSEAVYSSGIGSASFKAGPALKNFTFDYINGATAGGWNGRTLDNNAFFEYNISPEQDATITFNQLKFEVSLSSVNMRTSIYYSKDGFNRQSVPLGNSVFVGKKSSRDLIVETSITVTYPETLSIRIYGWSAPTPIINFFNRNVEFNGFLADNNKEQAVLLDQDEQGDEPGGERSVNTSTPFTTPGAFTWTCPAGVTSITVECWGGGGKGGSVNGPNPQVGGGAGGGGYSKLVNYTVVPGNTYNGFVGGGSTANNTPGGDSWFINNTTVLARGGNSVTTMNSPTGAIGGAVGIGTAGFIFIG
ncbi:MAG: hypothetical protein ACM3ME_07215, partial [Chloroflexota bacterium]